MRKCNICGKNISDFSENCPYCNNNQRANVSSETMGVFKKMKIKNALIIHSIITFVLTNISLIFYILFPDLYFQLISGVIDIIACIVFLVVTSLTISSLYLKINYVSLKSIPQKHRVYVLIISIIFTLSVTVEIILQTFIWRSALGTDTYDRLLIWHIVTILSVVILSISIFIAIINMFYLIYSSTQRHRILKIIVPFIICAYSCLFIVAIFFNINGINYYVTYSSQCTVVNCSNERNNNSDFCNEHVCNYIICDSEKLSGYQFCTMHICKYEGCPQSNSLELSILTCEEHTCRIWGCTNIVSQDSNYCTSHICMAQNCMNPKEGSTRYCSSHILRERIDDVTCSFEITTSGGLYLEFSYTNYSGKFIKSSHIDVIAYDLVGNELDTFPVDISCSGSHGTKIALGLDMAITGKTIGYSPQCSRIEVINFTIYYQDGRSEDGYEKLTIYKK